MVSLSNERLNQLIKPSFFDYNEKDFEPCQFWQVESEIESITEKEYLIIDSKIEYRFRCFRLQQMKNVLIQISLKIDKDLIFYSSSSNQKEILGYSSLKRVRVEFYDNICNQLKDSDDQKYCIFLSQNGFFEVIFFDNLRGYRLFQKVLRSRCILSHFGERYVPHNLIDQGQFAKVILATSKDDGKKYAVKTFNKTKLINQSPKLEQKQKTIINEIHVMRYLDHSNIIKLHEVYEGENHIYLVMDLVEGGQLLDHLICNNQFDEQQSRNLILQIINSLLYLDSKKIIHRDIKLENIILDSLDPSKIYLVDFGMAEFLSDKEKNLKKCGTPGYIAPEILNDYYYDQKADVFSCGVVLYNLLSGCYLFQGNSYNEIINQNTECNVMSQLEQLHLSPEVIDLLKKMLNHDPNQRYSIQEVMNHTWIQQTSIPVQNSRPFHIDINDSSQDTVQISKNQQFQAYLHQQAKDCNNHSIVCMTPLINGKTNYLASSSPLVTPNLNDNVSQSDSKKKFSWKQADILAAVAGQQNNSGDKQIQLLKVDQMNQSFKDMSCKN